MPPHQSGEVRLTNTGSPDPAVTPPSLLLALAELPRLLAELSRLPVALPRVEAVAPRGDGHPVMVLPGLATGPGATALLRRYVARAGYDVHDWGLGRNIGLRTIGDRGDELLVRLDRLFSSAQQPVSLVGWSLGGLMARLAAHHLPHAVRRVVTLGSPFAGSVRATNVWRLYQWLSGERIDDPRIQALLADAARPLSRPATAIYSHKDGLVAWRNCLRSSDAQADAIRVRGSHCGLAINPAVLWAVAERLSQPAGIIRPFDPGPLASLYPPADTA